MTHVNELPNEILLDVFDLLSSVASLQEYVAALLVCQQWYNAGLSNLYQHVALLSKLNEDSQLSKFSKRAKRLDLVRSMTYHLSQSHLMGFTIKLPKAFSRLYQMIGLFHQMPKLSVLSIVRVVQSDSKAYPFPDEQLNEILKVLPCSVTSLEIDVFNRHVQQPPTKEHICATLSPLLLRLRHLRIRPARCCPHLFSAFNGTASSERHDISALETLVLRTDVQLSNNNNNNEGHQLPRCMRSETYPRTGSLVDSPSGEPIPQNLAREARYLWERGTFPKLHTGYVIGRQSANQDALPPGVQPLHLYGATYDSYKVWDFVSNETRTVPTRERGGSSELVMVRALNGEDFFGNGASIDKAVEPSTWTSNSRGTRRPPELVFRSGPDVEILGLNISELIGRDTAVARHDVKYSLWSRETEVGSLILRARREQDLNDHHSVSEVLPPGWIEYREEDEDRRERWRIRFVGHLAA